MKLNALKLKIMDFMEYHRSACSHKRRPISQMSQP